MRSASILAAGIGIMFFVWAVVFVCGLLLECYPYLRG